jgi:DNA-binding MarR family transcriptional regulator
MTHSKKDDAKESQYAYLGLDRVIHERARLGVLTCLAANPSGLRFGDLKQLCGLTDGNLSRHVQVLQEASLIEISKSFRLNRPQTICRLTAEGNRRYVEYLSVLEQVVRDAGARVRMRNSRRTLLPVSSGQRK